MADETSAASVAATASASSVCWRIGSGQDLRLRHQRSGGLRLDQHLLDVLLEEDVLAALQSRSC
jgi:hypothetical protein